VKLQRKTWLSIVLALFISVCLTVLVFSAAVQVTLLNGDYIYGRLLAVGTDWQVIAHTLALCRQSPDAAFLDESDFATLEPLFTARNDLYNYTMTCFSGDEYRRDMASFSGRIIGALVDHRVENGQVPTSETLKNIESFSKNATLIYDSQIRVESVEELGKFSYSIRRAVVLFITALVLMLTVGMLLMLHVRYHRNPRRFWITAGIGFAGAEILAAALCLGGKGFALVYSGALTPGLRFDPVFKAVLGVGALFLVVALFFELLWVRGEKGLIHYKDEDLQEPVPVDHAQLTIDSEGIPVKRI
jgi:hypothetical protein